MHTYKSTLKKPSRSLRKNMTDAEQLLWKHIRRKQIIGIQFNRQKPILNYIVDFYAAKAKLVIEIDGSQHLEENNKIKDIERDKDLNSVGLTILRFDNRQVLTETESVLQEIYGVVAKMTDITESSTSEQIPPSPPLIKGGTQQ